MKNERITKALEMLENGVRETFTSERFENWLSACAKFRNYSINNQILIATQRPDATRVAGFNTWKNEFKRNVKKGERGIMILAPMTYKKTIQMEDEDGNVTEETVANMSFRPVYVFDVAQTEGEDIPDICNTLTADVDGYDKMKKALEEIAGTKIEYRDFEGAAYGFYNKATDTITVKDSIPQAHKVKTTVHEIAHRILHSKGGAQADAERGVQEVQAESVAFIVCDYFGIMTNDYSFEYVASWAENKDVKELKQSLGYIRDAANSIIEKMESAFI